MTIQFLPLGSIVREIVSGVSPVCEERAASEAEPGVLKLSAITGAHLDLTAAKAIAPHLLQPSWPRVRGGSVLITRASGSKDLVGACVLVPHSCSNRIIPDTAWQLSFDNGCGVPARWVVEYLRSPAGRRAIHQIARGTSGIAKITKEAFRRIEIPVLGQERMVAATAALDAYDRLSAGAVELLTAKRTLKRALLHDLVTAQRRFPEFSASGPWERLKIGDVADQCSLRAGTVDRPVLSCTKHRGLVPSLSYFGKQVFSRNLSSYKVIQRGEFAYATNHIEEGSIGVLEDCDAGLVSPMYTVFGVDRRRVLPEFLYCVLKTEHYRRMFQRLTSGSVDRRGALRWSLFRTIELSLPCLAEQRRIASTLRAFDREIALVENLREAHEALRRELLQALLSGSFALPEPSAAPRLVHV